MNSYKKTKKASAFGEPSSHAGIGSGNAVENVIKRNFGSFRIAVLAAFDQALGFVQSRGANEDHVLFFGRGIKEVARHGADSITAAGHRVQTIRLLALVRFTD